MAEQWFESMFGEMYCQFWTFLEDPARIQREAALAKSLLGLEPPARVLDVPCGWGRIAVPLAEAGFVVSGADLSTVQVERARRHVEAAGVSVSLAQADMRSLPYPDGSFDGLLNFFTDFGYFDHAENRRTLSEFRRVLAPGGVLVLELANRDHILRNHQRQSWRQTDDGNLLVMDSRFDPVTDLLNVEMTWHRGGERQQFHLQLMVYSAGELSRMVEEAGFEVSRVVSTMGEEVKEFTLDPPPSRFAVVATRKG